MNRDKEKIRELHRLSGAFVRSMEASQRHASTNDPYRHASFKLFARKFNALVVEVANLGILPPLIDVFKVEDMPGSTDTLPSVQKEVFDIVYTNATLLTSYLHGLLGIADDEMSELVDFLGSRFRAAVLHRPASEKDVQDCLEQLLIGRGLVKGQDYDREVGRVKVSKKEVIPDFIFPPLDLALEVKLVTDEKRSRAVVDELNADILAYRLGYSRQIHLVYDLGFVRDEVEFRHDLESHVGVRVLVVKH